MRATAFGGCELEQVISHQYAVGSMQLAVCSWQYAVGSMQYAVCSMQLAVCSWQYAANTCFFTDYCRLTTVN